MCWLAGSAPWQAAILDPRRGGRRAMRDLLLTHSPARTSLLPRRVPVTSLGHHQCTQAGSDTGTSVGMFSKQLVSNTRAFWGFYLTRQMLQ